jgi:hypothetical protein
VSPSVSPSVSASEPPPFPPESLHATKVHDHSRPKRFQRA